MVLILVGYGDFEDYRLKELKSFLWSRWRNLVALSRGGGRGLLPRI
jgi:hypothetical protein